MKTQLDYSKIKNIEIEDIDHMDYPDFCDAYISYAEYDGVPLTEHELDELNEDADFVHEQVMEYIY